MILALINKWREGILAVLIGLCAFMWFLIGVKNHQLYIWKGKYSNLQMQTQLQNQEIEQLNLAYINQQKEIAKKQIIINENNKKSKIEIEKISLEKVSEKCVEAIQWMSQKGQQIGKDWNEGY